MSSDSKICNTIHTHMLLKSYIILLLLYLQCCVRMARFNWWEVPTSMKDVWKSASMRPGELFAMDCGLWLMLMWSAGSWDMQQLVHTYTSSIAQRTVTLSNPIWMLIFKTDYSYPQQ